MILTMKCPCCTRTIQVELWAYDTVNNYKSVRMEVTEDD